MKWFLLILAAAVIYAIMTGYMGGAREATMNYNKLLTGKPVTKAAKKKEE